MKDRPDKVALIGFGEVGQRLAKDLLAGGAKEICAWDIAFTDRANAQFKAAQSAGIAAAASPNEALKRQSLIICAVTAASAEAAAKTASESIERGALYADVNSVSPGTKERVCEIIEGAGARFVEVAIMSPIGPRGLGSPMLLGGKHASDFAALMQPFGTDMTVASEAIGKASATKMCRSVLYKGLEALFIESMISARYYGVEKEVLASLKDALERGWPETARYMISRALIHGRRRAEEMREAAKTVAEAGLDPLVTQKVAERQDWAADRAAHLVGTVPSEASLDELLDQLTRESAAAASK